MNTFANITNQTMKTEEHAWQALRAHAASRLSPKFADRVLDAVRGPRLETWRQLQTHAAAEIRPGFAERVLRAAREFPANVPSLVDQFVLGAATVAVCLVAVVAFHSRTAHLDEQVALASWQQLAVEAQDIDLGL